MLKLFAMLAQALFRQTRLILFGTVTLTIGLVSKALLVTNGAGSTNPRRTCKRIEQHGPSHFYVHGIACERLEVLARQRRDNMSNGIVVSPVAVGIGD